MLKSSKPLKNKTPLKRSSPIKKQSLKPKKQKTPSLTALRRKADSLFAHYIRLRDAEFYSTRWVSECISCGRVNEVRWYDEDAQKWRWGRKEHNGHYVERTNYFLRYNEYNCNGQCEYCNTFREGNRTGYTTGLKKKYGDEIPQELWELAEAHKDYSLTKEDLERVIKASNDYLKWCYEQENT